jgi:hypothetical protein
VKDELGTEAEAKEDRYQHQSVGDAEQTARFRHVAPYFLALANEPGEGVFGSVNMFRGLILESSLGVYGADNRLATAVVNSTDLTNEYVQECENDAESTGGNGNDSPHVNRFGGCTNRGEEFDRQEDDGGNDRCQSRPDPGRTFRGSDLSKEAAEKAEDAEGEFAEILEVREKLAHKAARKERFSNKEIEGI